ncbi:MAG: DUF4395 domain-containing protein [Candidatus Neomarinimicrobiota bacterium]
MSSSGNFFYFPQVVNDWTARVVALQIVIWTTVVLVLEAWWVIPFLAVGFWLRVGWGPRYSPAAKIATRLLVPLLGREKKPIAGTPKRFAQLMGALLTSGAGLLILVDSLLWARALLSVLVVFAFLEAFVGFCAGCAIYRFLAKAGLFPAEICVNCVLEKDHIHGEV